MSYDGVYTCDACGKKGTWKEAHQTWTNFRVHPEGFGPRRKNEELHSCSTACDRKILVKLGAEPPTQEQLDNEARSNCPDLARQLEEQSERHRQEIDALRAEKNAMEVELMRARSDVAAVLASKASPPVTHDDVRRWAKVFADEVRHPSRRHVGTFDASGGREGE